MSPSISRGQRALEPKIRRRKVQSLSIETAPPVAIHADGVPLGQTAATIIVILGMLHVRVSEKVALGGR
jgi:diacylglycerol kinase family enzyme